jgi:dTDP-4-amino-4,6-dideoxygalactose transaminase
MFRYGAEDDPSFKKKCVTFEIEFAQKMGAAYCVGVSSGTGALLACLAALGIGAGDEVIVPGYTFIASISSIMLANAVPVLAEVDESLTLDPRDIEKRITSRTKAIMPVHMLGNPCDMDPIMAIAKKHGLYVIEDCCQACGAIYKGKRVGTIGDIGAFSLNIFKTITAGDGGAVITDSPELYERAFGYHDQGHKPMRTGVEVGNRSLVGMNMRMNELTGAVALAQLRKLDLIIELLKDKKAKLKARLANIPGVGFRRINDAGECNTLLTLLFDTPELAAAFCAKAGIKPLSSSGWHVYNNMEQILHKKTAQAYPFGQDVQYHAHMLPQTDAILDRAVNISVGVVDKGLGASIGININSTDAEIDATAEKIKALMKEI